MMKESGEFSSIEDEPGDVTALTRKLISLPSFVDDANDETRLTDFLFSLLTRHLPGMRLIKQFIDGSQRYNLILKGAGNPRLLVMGHVDTVHPCAGWETDPLRATVREGSLYGLGASDMKGSLAAFLWALLQERDSIATSELMVLMYVDEEYDFQGMKHFVQSAEMEDLKPDLIVSLDGSLQVATGCRGLVELHLLIRGRSAHSANPNRGVNAITETVEAIQDVKLRLQGYVDPNLGPTTVNVAYMRGGVVRRGEEENDQWLREGNKVPDTAEVILEVRPSTAEVSAEHIIDSLRYHLEKRGLALADVEVRHDISPWPPVTQEAAFNSLRAVYAKAGVEFGLADSSFGGYIDAQMIAVSNAAPTFIIGAGGSNKHAANERVPVRNLEQAAALYRTMLREML